MHACTAVTLEQLLSLRDHVPKEAYVAQHVNLCPTCTRELVRLRGAQASLRALPLLVSPEFQTLSQRANRNQARHERRRAVGSIAAAACVSALALLIAYTVTSQPDVTSLAADSPADLVDDTSRDTIDPVSTLVKRSQALESRLSRLPRPHVERASTAATIDSIQSRIQWVDYQLSLASDVGLTEHQAAQLWQGRVQLMDTLVKLRDTQTPHFALLQ